MILELPRRSILLTYYNAKTTMKIWNDLTVSVIIPSYNCEMYIDECIQSVLNQTWRKYEIIIVDDGSTDSSPALIQKYYDHKNVKIFKNCNKGRGAARRFGVNQSNGKFIAFLDCDDLLLPNSIEKRVKALLNYNDFGLVFTDAMEFDNNGDTKPFLRQFPWLNLKDDIFNQLLRGCFPLTSTVMVRREDYYKSNGFDENLRYGEDLDLFLRLSNITKFILLPEILTRRRMHPQQGCKIDFDRWNSRTILYDKLLLQNTYTKEKRKNLREAKKFAYYKLGEVFWEAENYFKARDSFFKSVCINKRSLIAFVYALISVLPTEIINILRKIISKLR